MADTPYPRRVKDIVQCLWGIWERCGGLPPKHGQRGPAVQRYARGLGWGGPCRREGSTPPSGGFVSTGLSLGDAEYCPAAGSPSAAAPGMFISACATAWVFSMPCPQPQITRRDLIFTDHQKNGNRQMPQCQRLGNSTFCWSDTGVGKGCIRRGGGGGGLGPPPPWVPLWSPPKAGRKLLSVNPLGTEGAEAKFWLSASNIGRGGGGVGRSSHPPSSSCGVRPF